MPLGEVVTPDLEAGQVPSHERRERRHLTEIGATDEGQFLLPVNPQSLSIDSEGGIRVRPEHIHLALRQFAGIDTHPFSNQFPLGVSEDELLLGFFG